jgi:hypothetical protein
VAQGTGEPALADAGGPAQDQIVVPVWDTVKVSVDFDVVIDADAATAVESELLRWIDITLSVAQFRAHHQMSEDTSPDWDRSWLDYLRTNATRGEADDHAATDQL